MMELVGPFNSGEAVGSDGSATMNTDSPIVVTGTIIAVAYQPNSNYASLDLVLATKGTHAPAVSILSESGITTEGWKYPRLLAQDNQGADLTAIYTLGVPIADYVNVLIENANSGDALDVWLLVER